jgi:L-alanine-DL-glutamate epimerase-like enolase superfamily enzyme
VISAGVDLSLSGLLAAAPPIQRADVHAIVLRKKDPQWRFALAANPVNPGFIFRVIARDGTVGMGAAGEIAHIGHSLPAMRTALDAAAGVLTAGAGPDVPAGALDTLDAAGGPARAIVHMALLDLVARDRGRPVHELLGPSQRRAVQLARIIPLKTPGEMAAAAAELAKAGYRYLKIKLDNESADLDVARIAAIRQAIGPDVRLTIDANQSYEADDAIAVARRLEGFGIDVFEQPCPADDIEGLAAIRRASPIPVEADESATSLDRIEALIENRAVDGVSIKIPKLGGIDRALAAAEMCGRGGIAIRMGAHVGSQLLNAAAVHLAVVLDNLAEPSELAEFARLLDDPVTGLSITEGRLEVPPGTGFGTALTRALPGGTPT